MPDAIQNRLAAIRKSRRVGAAELARGVGVSRQTIYAIEAGSYVPNTEIALRLARELEVPVEEMFALTEEPRASGAALATRVLSQRPPCKGQPARLCRVEERWVSVPASAVPYYLPDADGLFSRLARTGGHADVVPFSGGSAGRKRLVLAGCDPATSLLAGIVERAAGIEIVPAGASSRLALAWLKEGLVHIAGSHLEDPQSGEFNLPYLKRHFPDEDLAVITFARWEEGLVTAPGNPKGIRAVEHLARRGVRFINREAGSGSRALLDRLLQAAGLPGGRVRGYEVEACGHLAAGRAVSAGEADCCVATRSAARTFGLDFIPLKSERYDLVMRRQTLELPAARQFLDVLQQAGLRRKLEALAGYDMRDTGSVLA